MTITNFRRAERAAKLFCNYATRDHAKAFDPAEVVLYELLLDLMHFAERQILDFESSLNYARATFETQVESEL